MVATGNGGEGVYAKLKRLIATNVTASNNGGSGIDGHPVRAIAVTANDNADAGLISARVVSVRDSTVTGNGAVHGGLDIQSERRPRVRNTTCGYNFGAAGSWGVCTND